MSALAPNDHVSLFRRFVAALSVALLLLLSASAVSPSLHEHLHAHDGDHASPTHVCAIVLFGSGLVLAAALLTGAPSAVTLARLPALALISIFAAPPHRLPPGRGPPAC